MQIKFIGTVASLVLGTTSLFAQATQTLTGT
jgi:hypothetical protein